MQKTIEQKYVRNVSRLFPCFYPNKSEILRELKINLRSYFNEHSQTSTEELYSEFGSPEEYVNAVIENTEPGTYRNNIKMRKFAPVFGIVIAILIIAIAFFIIALSKKFMVDWATYQFYH